MSRRAVAAKVESFLPWIEAAAKRHGLPAAVLAGLVCQESAGNTWAARPEPLYKWIFGRRAAHLKRLLKLLPQWRTVKQDFYMQRISLGLCQVMGAVAREYGLTGNITKLCQPWTGLEYGAMHLAAKLRRADGDLEKALLLYNGGGDKQYPAKVFAWAREMQGDLP